MSNEESNTDGITQDVVDARLAMAGVSQSQSQSQSLLPRLLSQRRNLNNNNKSSQNMQQQQEEEEQEDKHKHHSRGNRRLLGFASRLPSFVNSRKNSITKLKGNKQDNRNKLYPKKKKNLSKKETENNNDNNFDVNSDDDLQLTEMQQQDQHQQESHDNQDEINNNNNDKPRMMLPIHVIVERIFPFLDRNTFNHSRMANQELYSSTKHLLPPWPETRLYFGSWVWSVVFSSNGLQMACGCDNGKVRIYNRKIGLQASWYAHGDCVRCVSFSPDGTMLATGSGDSTVRIWYLQQHQQQQLNYGYTNNEQRLSSTNNNNTLVLGGNHNNTLFESNGGTNNNSHWKFQELQGHNCHVYAVAWSPTGNNEILASGSYDTQIRIWNVPTATCLSILRGHQGAVSTIAFSPDGNSLASGSFDDTIRLWDLCDNTSKQLEKHEPEGNTIEAHGGSVTSLAFSPNGNLLASASIDRTVRLWDLWDDQTDAVWLGHTDSIHSVAFAPPHGDYIAYASRDGTIRRWTIAQSEPKKTTLHGNSYSSCLAFSINGRTLASAQLHDCSVRLWNV